MVRAASLPHLVAKMERNVASPELLSSRHCPNAVGAGHFRRKRLIGMSFWRRDQVAAE
jgi:hypothetical protein